MSRKILALLLVVSVIFVGIASPAPLAAQAEGEPGTSRALFIQNVGQFPADVRFQVYGGENSLWLTDAGFWLTVLAARPDPRPEQGMEAASPVTSTEARVQGVNLKVSFPGANPQPRLEPFGQEAAAFSYFLGADAQAWHSNVPVWQGVRYIDLYPGIDLELTSQNGRWVQRLIAQPGANLEAVQLQVQGAQSAAFVPGALQLKTSLGEIALPLFAVDAPLAQPPALTTNAQGLRVVSPFVSQAVLEVTAPAILPNQILIFSTFLGGYGRGGDWGRDVAVAQDGTVYVMGTTFSGNFPTTPGAFDRTLGLGDLFVTRFDQLGSHLLSSTFIGGGGDDYGYGMALDSSGAVYLTGYTWHTDFPTTPGAFQTQCTGCGAGGTESFAVKLNPPGNALVYSTYLGSNGTDVGYEIAVDSAGAAYVTGRTDGTNFPTTPGAFQPNHPGGYSNAFLTKLNPAGSALVYSTYIGGSGTEWAEAVAVNASGAAYVVGNTFSYNFPTTPGAFDRTFAAGGWSDGFLVKVNPSGSQLLYGTYLGGTGPEFTHDVAIGPLGNAYVTGDTWSDNFPFTAGAFDTTPNGETDVFVARFNADASQLVYATLLGGTAYDGGNAIAVDKLGYAYVTGTATPGFPVTPGAFDLLHTGADDAFLTRLAPNGASLQYSTFLGGAQNDTGFGIAIDRFGTVTIAGTTESPDFPTTPWSFDRTLNRTFSQDAFVTRFWISPASAAGFNPALGLVLTSEPPVFLPVLSR